VSLVRPRSLHSFRRRQLLAIQCLASLCSPPAWHVRSTNARGLALRTQHTHIRQRRSYRHCRAYQEHHSYSSSGAQLLLHPQCRHRPPPRSPERPHRNQQTRKVHQEVQKLDVRARPMSLRLASIASERTSAAMINDHALAVWHQGNR
jgi:hypothetical protein